MDFATNRSYRYLNLSLLLLFLMLVAGMVLQTKYRSERKEREKLAAIQQVKDADSVRRAASEGNLERLASLLPKVTLTYEQGQGVISAAVYNGHTDIVRFLFDQGWKVKGKRGGSLLESAACFGYTDIVELLLSRGADPSSGGSGDNRSALAWACSFGHDNTVKLLLDAGADIDAASQGLTPLMFAAQYGHIETVKLLLSRGADVRIRFAHGTTALSMAKYIEKPVVRTDVGAVSTPTPERAKQNFKPVRKDEHRIALMVDMLRKAGAME